MIQNFYKYIVFGAPKMTTAVACRQFNHNQPNRSASTMATATAAANAAARSTNHDLMEDRGVIGIARPTNRAMIKAFTSTSASTRVWCSASHTETRFADTPGRQAWLKSPVISQYVIWPPTSRPNKRLGASVMMISARRHRSFGMAWSGIGAPR